MAAMTLPLAGLAVSSFVLALDFFLSGAGLAAFLVPRDFFSIAIVISLQIG
jgi:hypothetical protein